MIASSSTRFYMAREINKKEDFHDINNTVYNLVINMLLLTEKVLYQAKISISSMKCLKVLFL